MTRRPMQPRSLPMTQAEARENELVILIAGDMFAAGYDTAHIAARACVPEAAALAALEIARARQGRAA